MAARSRVVGFGMTRAAATASTRARSSVHSRAASQSWTADLAVVAAADRAAEAADHPVRPTRFQIKRSRRPLARPLLVAIPGWTEAPHQPMAAQCLVASSHASFASRLLGRGLDCDGRTAALGRPRARAMGGDTEAHWSRPSRLEQGQRTASDIGSASGCSTKARSRGAIILWSNIRGGIQLLWRDVL